MKFLQLQLIFFRNKKMNPRSFTIKNGNAEMLIEEIEKVGYDGGTTMGTISPDSSEKVPDFYLLFTDGISNFGKEEPAGFKAPVYIFSGSSSANHSFLKYLSLQTGGIYFNLKRVDEEMVLRTIGFSPFSFISATAKKATVSEIYPKTALPVQGRFVLAGKLLAQNAKITINYGIKGKILKKVSLSISKDNAGKGNLLRTFWAQKKVEDLLIFQKGNRNELIETGEKYGLVTPGTSLIVLENLGQYLEYEIMPPESLPEMRKQYKKLKDRKKLQKEKEKKDKLEYVLELWKKRIEWWNRDFPSPPPKPEVVKKTTEQRIGAPVVEMDPDLLLISLLERSAQVIAGVVRDEDESVLPGTSVTLANTNSAISYETVTNAHGIYFFNDIPPGNYGLKAELQGFQRIKIINIRFSEEDKGNLYPHNSITLRSGRLDDEITIDGGEVVGFFGSVEGGVEGGVVGGVLGGVVGEVDREEAEETSHRFSHILTTKKGIEPSTPDLDRYLEGRSVKRLQPFHVRVHAVVSLHPYSRLMNPISGLANFL